MENRALKIFGMTLFCGIFIFLLASMPALADSGKSTDEVLVVGVPMDRCPVFYLDSDTKEITGIGVDLMGYAAQEAGYQVRFQPVEEDTLKEALDNPAYDLVLPFGSAIDSASGRHSIVSDNLIQTPFTLLTKEDGRLPQMNTLHIGMLSSQGAVAETVRGKYPGMEISLYETTADCIKALRSGKVDVLLHNSYVWSYVLQKPSYRDLAIQPSTMFSMDFRAGTLDTPEGHRVIQRLNDGIASMSETHRQAIVLDHTSRRLYQYDLFDYLYQYGLIILTVFMLIIGLILLAQHRIRAVHRAHEKRLQEIMDHDPLTGLLSLRGFQKRVEELLRTHPDMPYFISYNNVRDFKFINDSLGREAGDELLKFWAVKSMENLSEEEEAIGRVDSDHFAVLRHIAGEERMREDEKNVFEPVHNFFIN